MINQYTLNDSPITLKSDLAGEFPLYLYLAEDKKSLLFSASTIELLKDARVKKPLPVSSEGISFLLQSGVVPPPKTVYENVFIVGIGDSVELTTQNNQIQLSFKHEFPFLNANRLACGDMRPDEDLILQMLAEASLSRIDESKPTFLFHSAGKDSNSIVLALAEAGWQNKVTLITHKSKGQADESEISKSIANRLGFKHQVLHEVDQLHDQHKRVIENYFINAPFPCADNVTLAYPLYSWQMPQLKGANILDGMGNDVFIGHIPSHSEFKGQKISKYFKHARLVTQYAPSESLLHVAGRTRCEWTGLAGLSYADVNAFYSEAKNVARYWQSKDKDIDYLDLRASIRGIIIDPEIFTRKVRNFSDSISANLILPWANQSVAEYFAKMPEAYLFDRKQLKNKLILRKMLKDRIGLDSDKLGKMYFSYDSCSMVLQNWDYISQEINQCKFWQQPDLARVTKRLKETMQSNHKYADFSGRLIYRLYLLSGWLNRNMYLQN